MNDLVSETLSAAAHHTGSTHRAGHGLADTLLSGFVWRIGSDAANAVFHAAPTAFVGAVLVVGVLFLLRRLKRRNQS